MCDFAKAAYASSSRPQPDQRQTEQVVGPAVFRVGIEGRQPCDSGSQVLQRLVETSRPVASGRECGVGRRVSRSRVRASRQYGSGERVACRYCSRWRPVR